MFPWVWGFGGGVEGGVGGGGCHGCYWIGGVEIGIVAVLEGVQTRC